MLCYHSAVLILYILQFAWFVSAIVSAPKVLVWKVYLCFVAGVFGDRYRIEMVKKLTPNCFGSCHLFGARTYAFFILIGWSNFTHLKQPYMEVSSHLAEDKYCIWVKDQILRRLQEPESEAWVNKMWCVKHGSLLMPSTTGLPYYRP